MNKSKDFNNRIFVSITGWTEKHWQNKFKEINKFGLSEVCLFLEMNTDNFVSQAVKVKKIGGFCVDVSHFKVEEEKWSAEFEYILRRRYNRRFLNAII